MVNHPPPALRLIFFGTPEFATASLAALLDSRHQIALVITQPDRPRGRGYHPAESPVRRMAGLHALPTLQPGTIKDPSVGDRIANLAPDLGVAVAYGQMLPEVVLSAPRLGTINVHASLLPRHRGAAPVHRAILAGDQETGVTIMRIVRELDAGPILAQISTPISAVENSLELEARLAALGADVLVGVIDQLATGSARERPQDPRQATYAPRLTKEEGLIRWERNSQSIHDAVRGLHPWPHAFTFLDRQRLIILESSIEVAESAGAPGTVLASHGDRLTVATGDGRALRVLRIQPEGRRPMTTQEFLTGHRVPVGAVLGPKPA